MLGRSTANPDASPGLSECERRNLPGTYNLQTERASRRVRIILSQCQTASVARVKREKLLDLLRIGLSASVISGSDTLKIRNGRCATSRVGLLTLLSDLYFSCTTRTAYRAHDKSIRGVAKHISWLNPPDLNPQRRLQCPKLRSFNPLFCFSAASSSKRQSWS